MIRTCVFDRFQTLRLPLVIISVATVLLTSMWSPLLLHIQPQTFNGGNHWISQLEGLEDAAVFHKMDDSSPKVCNLLVTFDARNIHNEVFCREYCRPHPVSATPLSFHLVYTQTVSEHL